MIYIINVFFIISLVFVSSTHANNQNNLRIIGGQASSVEIYPWLAALVKTNNNQNDYQGQFCAGSLIHSRWIVTAAHCVVNRQASQIEVVLKKTNLRTEDNAQTERIKIEKIYIHPHYDISQGHDHDIALLALSTKSKQPPVRIDQAVNSQTKAGSIVSIIGWGRLINEEWLSRGVLEALPNATIESGKIDCQLKVLNEPTIGGLRCLSNLSLAGYFSPELHQVYIPIIAQARCEYAYREGNIVNNLASKVTKNMLCAGFTEGGRDACDGDSGGPVIALNKDTQVLVGIVSWSVGCAKPSYYGVNTRISQYEDFINNTIQKATFLGGCKTLTANPPVLTSQHIQQDNQLITHLNWNAVEGAEHYRLLYAPFPDADVIAALNMGEALNLTVPLPLTQQFYVAIQARDALCAGSYSNILIIPQ